MFEQLDQDSNGSISMSELSEGLRQQGYDVSFDEVMGGDSMFPDEAAGRRAQGLGPDQSRRV
jgi:Ca2+-binding EF-hand superfamily protein